MADETEVWAPGSADPKVAFAEFQLHLREVTPRLRVVPILIALNVLVFAVMCAMGVGFLSPAADQVRPFGADYGPLTLGGQPWRVVTNVFVHFGIVHILANMIALLSSGPIVERLFGPLAFAALYLAAGIAGSLLSVGAHPLVVSAGASGAIFGVYGALGMFVLRQRGAIPAVVVSKLGSVAGSFIVYNIVFGAAHSGIDNTAHIGGLLGGAAAGAFLVRPLVPARPSAPRGPLVVVVVAACLAFGVPLVLPKSIGFDTVLKTYETEEAKILAHYNGMLPDFDSGKLSRTAFAQDIDRTTLPDWRAMSATLKSQRQDWERHQTSTQDQKDLLDLVERLVKTREEGWTRMSAKLAAWDIDGFSQAAAETEASVRAIIEQEELLEQAAEAKRSRRE